ncbi:Helicase POLQ-like [Habropoda laboriosa]|uniref:Helicase POLQ-like n=1 Tax=Habropoda laboriosa TaxID=597456 RepID=A0A0L7RFI6_9HYME|nr:Helicase POLQ-like [Habropoda laboriosa]
MDDTILKNIESDDDNGNVKNEMCIPTSNIHEKTLSSFAHEWSTCDIFEMHENCEEAQSADNKKEFPTEQVNQGALTISHNIPNEANTHWQDNTLLNETFLQFHSCDVVDELQCLPQDIIQAAENCFEKIPLTEITDSMYLSKNEQQNNKSLKRNLVGQSNDILNKVYCSNDKINQQNIKIHHTNSTSNDTFYGLPKKVQDLFFQVRGIETLYQWQDECLNLNAVKNRKNLIYALPTSGGKTLVAEVLMLKELICSTRNAMFILPFVAIVQEKKYILLCNLKVQAMTPFALELDFLIEEYAASKGTYPPKKRRKKKSMYMCTIEKALGLINSLIEENRFNEIGIIVVDELHLLGESGGRGAALEVLLTKTLFVNENIHIVGMSATIGNLNEVAEFLNADLYTGNFRPVEIKEYVKCDDNIWLLDLKTEELLTDIKKINYRYSNEAAIIDPDRIGGLVMDIVPGDSCLIFCSSRKNCENVALLLTKVLFKSLENYKKDDKQKLINALENEEGLCPILRKTIIFGVAYHHSGLTSEERHLLENAFKAGTLCVICCTSTLAAGVKELLTSKMNDSLSTLHVDKDRGIHNLILSAIFFPIATTRFELYKLAKRTLLNIQEKQTKQKERIKITNKTKLELCNLGRAAIKGCIEMQCAYTLYQDLKKAQEHLILIDYLHLLYLVTPYDIISQIKPVTNLAETQMKTARLLGINEISIGRINVEPRVVQRFYITLILYDLWTQHAVYGVSEKYQVNRGLIQNLLNTVASFAFSVVRFCQELEEFSPLTELLNTFSKKLSYCCPLELEALMVLPLVKIGRARQLYNAGFRTVQCIAKANPSDLQNKIPYLNKRAVIQIIEAAKLIIVEKVEDLKEETEDFLSGININTLRRC